MAGWRITTVLGVLLAGNLSPGEDRLTPYLAAGEYAAALRLVASTDNPADQDQLLARTAAAQRQAGAWPASLVTSGLIDDPNRRAASLAEPQPLGGAAGADFDALIELITQTIAPASWDEAGGQGAVREFAGGVTIDPQGLVARLEREVGPVHKRSDGIGLHLGLPPAKAAADGTGSLRKLSLTRLEREIERRLAAGQSLTEEIQYCAGLERIQYVWIYPELGEIVLAGPASRWRKSDTGRMISTRTGLPVVVLEDFVVIWRLLQQGPPAEFGCSITPRTTALARAQEFLNRSGQQPLPPGGAAAWMDGLRTALGTQRIEVRGVDATTHVARVMVEADHHMKRIGLGLEPGPPGLNSYLDELPVDAKRAPPLDVLRWWFTSKYESLRVSPDGTAFELRGPGVQVRSENELLADRGQRVATGQSHPLNQQFANTFTRHFAATAEMYPVYGALRNLFDWALVAALIEAERLDERVGWQASCFAPGGTFPVRAGVPPKAVETIANHRVIQQVHVVGAVSGGVTIAPWPHVRRSGWETVRYGPHVDLRGSDLPPDDVDYRTWWWD